MSFVIIVQKIINFLIFFESLKIINSCYFKIDDDIKQTLVKWQSFVDSEQKNRIEAVSQNIIRLDGIEKYKTNLLDTHVEHLNTTLKPQESEKQKKNELRGETKRNALGQREENKYKMPWARRGENKQKTKKTTKTNNKHETNNNTFKNNHMT